MVVLGLAAVALVGVHLGPAGAVAEGSGWTGRTVDVVAGLLAVKVVFVLVGLRRRASRGARRGGSS